MKKRLIITFSIFILSLSLMGCPTIKNSPPKLVKIVDGEIIKINEITYEHPYRADFDAEAMVAYLIENKNLVAIDYDQSNIVLGNEREYFDVSDSIICTSFYEIWLDDEDANLDGVVDDLDIEYYGQIKTDEFGNKQYDSSKIFLVQVLPVDSEFDFTLWVDDDNGDFTELSGKIIIVE